MRHWKATVVAVALAISLPTWGQAAFQGTRQEQAACRPDVRKFCRSVKPGSRSGAYVSCLKASSEKLSKPCVAVLTKHGVLRKQRQ
jgi:hypothetical protein